MATILPFRGVRYSQAKIANLDSVVAPPYDVISPTDRQRYHAKHPHNVVRLILPTSTIWRDKYSEAAVCLEHWLNDSILVRDRTPSMYAYEQEYELDGHVKKRIGLTCLVRLETYDQGDVLPHEKIMAEPKEDRLNLIRATRANFDSVFALHAGPGVQEILNEVTVNPPDGEATDSEGVKSRAWTVSDPRVLSRLSASLDGKSLLIADGHHRYEAALAYRDEMRATTGVADPNAPCEYVMMTLISFDDEGLVVLPTHRLVRDLQGFDESSFVTRLGEHFDITRTPPDNLTARLKRASMGRSTFALYVRGHAYILKLKEAADPRGIPATGSDALRQLDVTVLHSLILDSLLGVDTRAPTAQTTVSYTHDDAEALRVVDSGEYQMAFLMNPMEVKAIKEVASAGDVMPQKSTFFYPKLLTGLVMRVM